MASSTSPNSILSSPVRFDTQTPELCPQPLRLSQGKLKNATDSSIHDKSPTFRSLANTQLEHDEEDIVEARPARPEGTATTPTTIGRLRGQSIGLGSLVSKFETLDAINSTEAGISRIPRLSKSRRPVQDSDASTTTSPEFATTLLNEPAVRRSQLPACTRLINTSTNGLPHTPSGQLFPQSPPAETESMSRAPAAGTGWDSRFAMGQKKLFGNEECEKCNNLTTNPNSFRVQQPGNPLSNSPRRLPKSSSSKTLPAVTDKFTQRERSSVANLRKSFEHVAEDSPTIKIPVTSNTSYGKPIGSSQVVPIYNPLHNGGPKEPKQKGIEVDTSEPTDGEYFRDVTCQNKDSGTQTELSFADEIWMTSKGAAKESSEPCHQNSKVGGFQKLFGRSKHDKGYDLSSLVTSASISESALPALRTRFSTEDFTCDFRNDFQVILRPAVTITQESTLRDRINHFEQLKDEPVSVAPKVPENRHPVRNVWRRISQSLTLSFDGHHNEEHYHSSYRETSTSMDHSTSPPLQYGCPMLPTRKSFPIMHKFPSDRESIRVFGLDGQGHSSLDGLDNTSLHVPDADIFSNNDEPRPSSKSNTDRRISRDSSIPKGGLPKSTRLLQQVKAQDRAARKEREKQEKVKRREERRSRIARRLHGNDGSEHKISQPSNASEVESGKWETQTASGFMVRQSNLDSTEMLQPQPSRPGQVKKVVNFYRSTSSSMLRLVSGGHYGRSKESSKDSSREMLGCENKAKVTTAVTQDNGKGKGKGKDKDKYKPRYNTPSNN